VSWIERTHGDNRLDHTQDWRGLGKSPATGFATWERAARCEVIDWQTLMRPWGSACDFPSALSLLGWILL
jgi:hypothetical protein